jgi:hypothetical protein
MEKLCNQSAEIVLRFFDKLGKRNMLTLHPEAQLPLVLERGPIVAAEWYKGHLFTMTYTDGPNCRETNLSMQFIVVDRRGIAETRPFVYVYPVKFREFFIEETSCVISDTNEIIAIDKKLQRYQGRLATPWLKRFLRLSYLSN